MNEKINHSFVRIGDKIIYATGDLFETPHPELLGAIGNVKGSRGRKLICEFSGKEIELDPEVVDSVSR